MLGRIQPTVTGTSATPKFRIVLLCLAIISLPACSDDKEPQVESVALSGAAQKGPFVLGSTVQVAMLDADGNPTGQVFNTTTINDLGEFDVTVEVGGWAKISVTGFYFNELTGELSNANITLHALAEISSADKQQTYINLVTHMAQRRALYLLKNGAASLAAAITEAESDLRSALGIVHPGQTVGKGTDMNLLGGDNADNEYLFGASCIIAQLAAQAGGNSVDARLQEITNQIALELEANGTIASSTLDRLVAAEKTVLPSVCMDNLRTWLQEKESPATPPDLGKVIDSDKDGVANGSLNDTDGDGVIDREDCAQTDATKQIVLDTGECVADDDDDDDDGFTDATDCAPRDATKDLFLSDGKTCSPIACGPTGDRDADGFSKDNCPLTPNPNQRDTDGDETGDFCDLDDDEDGILDLVDNCPLIANPAQDNDDPNKYGSACDDDFDEDNIPDSRDNCPTIANLDQLDGDSDGEGDACDADFSTCP